MLLGTGRAVESEEGAVPLFVRGLGFHGSRWIVLMLVAAMGALVVASQASATHFRYADLSWTPTGVPNQVAFRLQVAWRRDYPFVNGPCVNPVTRANVPCTGGFLPAPTDTVWEPLNVLNTGQGVIAEPGGGGLLYRVTAIDAANNWLFGVALDPANTASTSILYTYAGALTKHLAFIDNGARISAADGPNAHMNNPGGGYRVETIVDLDV